MGFWVGPNVQKLSIELGRSRPGSPKPPLQLSSVGVQRKKNSVN